jgi:hypothetical protein
MMRTSALNVPELLEEADQVAVLDAEHLLANLVEVTSL